MAKPQTTCNDLLSPQHASSKDNENSMQNNENQEDWYTMENHFYETIQDLENDEKEQELQELLEQDFTKENYLKHLQTLRTVILQKENKIKELMDQVHCHELAEIELQDKLGWMEHDLEEQLKINKQQFMELCRK